MIWNERSILPHGKQILNRKTATRKTTKNSGSRTPSWVLKNSCVSSGFVNCCSRPSPERSRAAGITHQIHQPLTAYARLPKARIRRDIPYAEPPLCS